MTPRIYTIGYAGWAPAALRDHVLALGATLVDVRIAPTSKSPQWRKVTKTRSAFPIEQAVRKLLFLVTRDITQK